MRACNHDKTSRECRDNPFVSAQRYTIVRTVKDRITDHEAVSIVIVLKLFHN